MPCLSILVTFFTIFTRSTLVYFFYIQIPRCSFNIALLNKDYPTEDLFCSHSQCSLLLLLSFHLLVGDRVRHVHTCCSRFPILVLFVKVGPKIWCLFHLDFNYTRINVPSPKVANSLPRLFYTQFFNKIS